MSVPYNTVEWLIPDKIHYDYVRHYSSNYVTLFENNHLLKQVDECSIKLNLKNYDLMPYRFYTSKEVNNFVPEVI